MGWMGELGTEHRRKGSGAASALGSHSCAGPLSTQGLGGCGGGVRSLPSERDSRSQSLLWPSCTCFCKVIIPCTGSCSGHGADWSRTVWGPDPGVPVCHHLSWTCHRSFTTHLWFVNLLPQLVQKLCSISNCLNVLSPMFYLHRLQKNQDTFPHP